MGHQLTHFQKTDFLTKMRHFKHVSFLLIKSHLNKYFSECGDADAKEDWQDCVKLVMKDNCKALVVSDLSVENLWRLGTIVSNLLGLANKMDSDGKVLLLRIFRQHLRIPLLNILRLWLRVDDKQDSPEFYAAQLVEAGTGGAARSAKTVYVNIVTIMSLLGNFEAKCMKKPLPQFCSCLDLIEMYKKDWCNHKGNYYSSSRLGSRPGNDKAMELSPIKSVAVRAGVVTLTTVMDTPQLGAC